MIRKASIDDAADICKIYNCYICQTIVTFDTRPLDNQQMARKMSDIISAGYPFYVFQEPNGTTIGYCYLTAWKTKPAYDKTAELTIYVDPNHRNKGIGSQLMNHLIQNLHPDKYHVIIAGISIPNQHSEALHQKFGFRKTAHFNEVGWKFDKWIDVAYWQKILKSPSHEDL